MILGEESDGQRLKRILADLGYMRTTMHLDATRITNVIWSRCGLTANEWHPVRISRLANSEIKMLASDVAIIAFALRIDARLLLYSKVPTFKQARARTLWDDVGPLG